MFAENNALTQTDSAEYQLLMRTLKRFVNAKTLGSLIQVPQEEEAELKVFLDALYRLEQEGDFQQKTAAKAFIPFIQQAWILAQRYDAVVANPPYMGVIIWRQNLRISSLLTTLKERRIFILHLWSDYFYN